MSQPIKPPTKVSLWSSDMSDAERLVHERLLLVFKEANETFNGAMLGEYLSDEVKYTSQRILDDMQGKDKIAQYLIDRYKFFEEKKREKFAFRYFYTHKLHIHHHKKKVRRL